MTRKCFIISPIGPPGSEIREHADDVFEFIIKPAVKKCEFVAERGDHASAPGKISTQMFDSILGDPLVIAVLNFNNPNVFYELAVAHAAARPLVILCEKSQELPFDIKDHRVIYYDLRPRPIMHGTYRDELIRAIEEVTRIDRVTEVPFGQNLMPLGGRGLDSGFKLYNKLIEAVTGGSFPHKIINEADKSIAFSGITSNALHALAGFETMIAEAMERKCKVTAFLMDEDNSALPHMLKDSSHMPDVLQQIKASTERWRNLARKFSAIEVVKVRQGMLLHQITMNEKRMLIVPYWTAVFPNEAPAIATDAGSSLYLAASRELESLRSRNGSLVSDLRLVPVLQAPSEVARPTE